MTLTPLVVVGAAGTGRETLDIIKAINEVCRQFKVVGVVDDHPDAIQLQRLVSHNTPYLGTMDTWLKRSTHPVAFVIAIAAPAVRKALAEKMQHAGHAPISLIHPRAIIGSQVSLGRGAIVYGNAQISTNVTTGLHAILNANVCIGHDTLIGDYVTVNPGATISGEVTVGHNVLIGGRATVLQGLTVGPESTVGAAALLTKSAPQGIIAKGVPARW